MSKKYIALFFLLFVIRGHSADTLLVFKVGDTARAGDVNANFKLLFDKLNSLSQDNLILKKTVDSLKGLKQSLDSNKLIWDRLNALNLENQAFTKAIDESKKTLDSLRPLKSISSSVDSINSKISATSAQVILANSRIDSTSLKISSVDSKIVFIPKGAIIASMVTPAADGYMPNSDQTWILAAGQSAINSVTIPDLRGVFLRGIEYTLSGNIPQWKDSTGIQRSPGSYQGDIFKSHSHNISKEITKSGPGTGVDSYWFFSTAANEPTTSTGGIETRPKNVSIYYYIKVK